MKAFKRESSKLLNQIKKFINKVKKYTVNAYNISDLAL